MNAATTQPVTADDIRALLDYSPRADATLVRWLDTGEVESVPAVLFSDISYSNRDREYDILVEAADLRSQGDWDTENPTDEDYEVFAQMLNENR